MDPFKKLDNFLYNVPDYYRDTYKKYLDELKKVYGSIKGELDVVKNINNELCLMFNNEEFSDFTFTVTEKTYYVHKVILASHSPVFAAMFRSNMKEKMSGDAVIDDCEPDLFELLLKYLYTGDLSIVKKFAQQLLPLSEKYQINILKTVCENNIEIESENAIRMLIMAKKYNANTLKAKAIDHILANMGDIQSDFTDQLKQLINDYPDLVFNIFEKM